MTPDTGGDLAWRRVTGEHMRSVMGQARTALKGWGLGWVAFADVEPRLTLVRASGLSGARHSPTAPRTA